MVNKKEAKKIGMIVDSDDLGDFLEIASREKEQPRRFRVLHLPARFRRKKRSNTVGPKA